MVNLLTKIFDVLPEVQKQAIKSLIENKKRSGELLGLRAQQTEITQIYDRIKSSLGKKLLSPRYPSQGDRISSEDHNKNMEEIYMDLNALYSSIDRLSKVGNLQSITLNSEYQKSRAAIQKLINDARIFALRKKHLDFNEIKLVDFNTSRNHSLRIPPAEVNPKTRLLELRTLDSTRVHLTERTTRSTTIYTKTYSQGLKGTLSTSFPPNNMVDQRPETFWGTLVMSDIPVSQRYESTTRTGSIKQIDVDGPVVEIYFKFSHVEKINSIKLLPFAEYPVRVLDISYKPTSTSQILYPVPDFVESTTLDWEELNFDPVFAHEVRITISQENYRRVIYHLPKKSVSNTDLFQSIFKLRSAKIVGQAVLDSDIALGLLSTIDSYQSAISSLQDIMSISGTDISIQTDLSYYDDFQKLLAEIYSTLDPDSISSLYASLTSRDDAVNPDQEEIIEINKYEYVLGMREVEIGLQIYSPTAYYESEKFTSQATISQIQMEIDEGHPEFKTQWEDKYRKTSTEWSIDIGGGRVLPIHPRNLVDDIDQIPSVKDERIYFDRLNNKAYTRLGGYYSSVYRLKKEGQQVPVTEYAVARITGSIPKIEISMTGSWLDFNSVYTVDYAVDPNSYNIEILDKFQSKPLDVPELFTESGPDNDISLQKYPYINYEVINLTGVFDKSADSSWTFVPDQPNVLSGQLSIFPTIIDGVGNILQSGHVTGQLITGLWGDQSGVGPPALIGNPNISNQYFGEINGVQYGYFSKVMDSLDFQEALQFHNTTGITFQNPFTVSLAQLKRWDSIQSGVVFSGSISENTASGTLRGEYVLGIGVKTDDQIFTISDTRYTPITVTIGGRAAQNITDYETLRHPAFSVANRRDGDYQYIHAGRKIYFNQPTKEQEIRVQYRWITEYVKILGTLRCNTSSNPLLTPKVNQIKLLINNLII